MIAALKNRLHFFNIAPSTRVSLVLAIYAAGILLTISLFGVSPDKEQRELEIRTRLSESLAVNLSLLISRNQLRLAEKTLNKFIERHPDVKSGFIKTETGLVLLEVGEIGALQKTVNDSKESIITHIKVPILQKDKLWGILHVEFMPLYKNRWKEWLMESDYGLALILGFFCFVGFLMILKRTLRELNPQDVIPARVQSAFNTLTEAVVIVDEHSYILLANEAFSAKVNRSSESLVGFDISSFKWVFRKDSSEVYPWERVLSMGKTEIGHRMRLITDDDQKSFLLSTNCSPIKDDKDKVRGALLTFEDISELEQQNSQLNNLINRLRESEKEITQKNESLLKLAQYDPLTDCYNRRTLFEHFDELFQQSIQSKKNLSCLMIDIDHFKSINDNYGHSVGDEAIKFVVAVIKEKIRDTDIVGRYGGEEFCIVLPDYTSEEAMSIAERIKATIQYKSTKEFVPVGRMTVSIGLCMLNPKISNPAELVDLADKALYLAKNSGRNRVVCWDPTKNEVDLFTKSIEMRNSTNKESEKILIDQDQTGIIKSLKQQLEALSKKTSEREQALQKHLTVDKITGLPTSFVFDKELKKAIEQFKLHQKEGAVFIIKFKASSRINEALGTNASNLLLQKLGESLTNIMIKPIMKRLLIDAKSIVACLDNDRFGVLISSMDSTANVAEIAEHLFDGIKNPIDLKGSLFYSVPLIGIALYPQDSLDATELVRKATIAKRYATNSDNLLKIQFYHQDMDEETRKLMRLENELQLAIKRNQLELHYQPCIDIKSGCIISAEALIRWEHQELGQIPAVTVIEIAEKNELIQELSEWVISTVCWQIHFWQQSGITPVRVFVNLSAFDIQNENIVNVFCSVLEKTGISTDYLGIEVTETALVQDVQLSSKILNQLSSLGLKIALDDFGTGYSSLSYLQNFNLDILKIDKIFLKSMLGDVKSAKLYSAIISMAHQLGLETIAEGIETKKEMIAVSKLGVDRLQGFYFCTPKAAHLFGQSLGKMTAVS